MRGRRTLPNRLAGLFAAGLGLFCGAAVADSKNREVQLEPILVEGARINGGDSLNRLGAPPAELPYTLRRIDVEELQEHGGTRIRDVALLLPGVSAGGTGGKNQEDVLFIRGFPSLFIAVNGLRRSNFDESPQGLANIARIEILKGAAAVEGGLVGPGGAINLVTKKPKFSPHYSLEMELISVDRQRIEVDLTGPIGESASLAYRLIVSWARGESYRATLESEHLLVAPSLVWRYRPGGKLLIETTYYYANTPLDQGVPYLEGAGFENDFAPPEFSYSGLRDYNKNKRKRIAIYWTHPITTHLSTRLSAEYRTRERRSRSLRAFPTNIYANGFQPPYRFSGNPTIFRTVKRTFPIENYNKTVQLELLGDAVTGAFEHHWVVGGLLARTTNDQREVLRNVFATINLFDPDYSKPLNSFEDPVNGSVLEATQTTESLFAQYKLDVGGWHFLAGVRRDHVRFEQEFNDFGSNSTIVLNYGQPTWSWRLGAVWDVTSNASVFLGASTGFLPQPGRLPSGETTGPRRNRSVELGLRLWALEGRLQTRVSLYAIQQTNVAEPDPNNEPGENFLRLTGEIRSRGVEFVLQYRVGNMLEVSANAAYTHARITENNGGLEGNKRYNVPTYSAGMRVALQLDRLGLENTVVDLGAFYVGSRPGDDANTFVLPAYTRVDLGVEHWFGEQVSMRFFVQNLFDERYIEYSSGRVFSVYPGAPRQFSMTLTYQY